MCVCVSVSQASGAQETLLLNNRSVGVLETQRLVAVFRFNLIVINVDSDSVQPPSQSQDTMLMFSSVKYSGGKCAIEIRWHR